MPLIDENALKEFYRGDEELLLDIANLFVENLPRVAMRLREAIANHDALELREVAHQFKSGLGYFFASELNAIAAELETRGKNEKLDGCDMLAQVLFHGLDRMIVELSRHTHIQYNIPIDL